MRRNDERLNRFERCLWAAAFASAAVSACRDEGITECYPQDMTDEMTEYVSEMADCALELFRKLSPESMCLPYEEYWFYE